VRSSILREYSEEKAVNFKEEWGFNRLKRMTAQNPNLDNSQWGLLRNV
jgi:hypothetical protein